MANKSQKGKKIWEIAPNPCGRPPIFKSPVTLWRKFLAYCQWVDDNPWEEKDAGNTLESNERGNKNSMHQKVKVYQRAYTLYGFTAYSGIYMWASFKQKYRNKDGFSIVINAIEETIRSQQVDGAMLRQFDSNLVARLNGIADKQISEVTGKDGSDLFKLPKLSESDIAEIRKLNDRL